MSNKPIEYSDTFSLYESPTGMVPTTITLADLRHLVVEDEAVRQYTEQARQNMELGDQARYDLCKKKSLCITASVLCAGGHSIANIACYNGCVMADLDHLASPQAAHELKQRMAQLPQVAAAWVTHSGEGLRLLLRYRLSPLTERLLRERYGSVSLTPEEFKLLRQHLLTPIATAAAHPCDPVTKDPSRLSFVCHDATAYFDLSPHAEANSVAVEPAVLLPPPPMEEFCDETVNYTDRADKLSLRFMERRGESYREGNRNNYLFARCCLLCRLGMSQSDAEAVALSQGADLPPEEVRALVGSAYRTCAAEAGTLQKMLQYKKRTVAAKKSPERGGTSCPDLAALEQRLLQRYLLRYNCLTRCIELAAVPAEPDAMPLWRERDDRALCILWRECGDILGKMVHKKVVKDLLESGIATPYDPLIDYLVAGRDTVVRRFLEERPVQWHHDPLYCDKEGRPVAVPWRRDEDQLRRVFGAVHTTCPDPELYLWTAAKWFVSAMATVLYPKDKGQLMLMIVGQPGIGKTRFFSYLWPQDETMQRYYSCTHPAEVDKDFRLQTTEQMFLCLDEYSQLSPKSLAALKSLITGNATTDRAPYAMLKQRRDRCTTFCGTGNDISFVEDDAMARRMPVFHALAIDNNGDLSDRVDYPLLYGQATYLLEHGMCYWLQAGGERERQLAEYEETFRAVPLEEELLMRYFYAAGDDGPHYEPVTRALLTAKFYTASDVIIYLSGLCGVRQPLSRVALGRALTRLGYQKRRIHGKVGYYLIARNHDEIARTAEAEAATVRGNAPTP